MMTVQPDADQAMSGTELEQVSPAHPTSPPQEHRWRAVTTHFASRYALLGVWAGLAVLYSVLMPHTFASASTLQAIFGSQSALLLLALSALCTLVVGEFDFSFASVMGLSATVIPVLTTLHGVPIGISCLVALGTALACGVINALFVVVLEVPSLVVTLGSASLFLGIAELIGSSTTVSVSDPGFSELASRDVLGLPLSFYYGVALCLVFAYVMAWTPLGRHIIFVGANRDVARLAGINVKAIRAGGYLVASLVAGLAGVLLIATVGGVDPSGSAVYLLPALAAVFLGTAVVHPGQFNPLGTFFGIYFLQTGIIGLQLLGQTGWVQNAFYGAGLVLAVTVAAIVRKNVRTA
jgi:ribose transport system permease protein